MKAYGGSQPFLELLHTLKLPNRDIATCTVQEMRPY